MRGDPWARRQHLQLALLCEGPLLEDVQNERSAVADARLLGTFPRQVPELPRAQLAVKDDCIGPSAGHGLQHLLYLAGPEVCLCIWIYVLREGPNHLQQITVVMHSRVVHMGISKTKQSSGS